MTELIIIKTEHSQFVKKILEEKQIAYEIYQAPSKNTDLSPQWENQALSKRWAIN